MKTLLGQVLVGLLKLVLRLIVFAITGRWVEFETGEQARPAPAQAPIFGAKGPDRALLAQQLEALRASQSPARASERAELEAFARDFGAPLEAYLREEGVGLKRRSFVVLTESGPAAASLLPALRAYTRHFPIVVPEGADGLEGYVTTARERARALSEDAPGLLQRLRRAHGWPEFLLLPGSEARLSPELLVSLRGAFGVWLPALLAEILLTLQLGPSYAAYLSDFPGPLTAGAGSHPRLLGDQPPRLLRLHAALGTLEFLGHFEESGRLERKLEKQFGERPSLPLQDEAPQAPKLPYELWRAELEGLLESVLEDVQPALGGRSLLDARGVAFSHGEQARAQRLAALLRDRDADLGAHGELRARDWLSAALLVREDGGLSENELALRLRHALHGPRRARRSEKKTRLAAPPAANGRPERLEALLRDPAAIRDAVALGALLGPRRQR